MSVIQDSGVSKGKYVVRGTPIQCSCGSAPDVLNLSESHHVYVVDQPILTVKDCVVQENIISFGSCSSSKHPDAKEEIEVSTWLFFSKKKEIDKAATGMLPCTPLIEANPPRWNQPHEDTLVNGEPALLDKATLICSHGGLIRIGTEETGC
ncbi:hypothetical protein D3C75_845440 [compost metagenome]